MASQSNYFGESFRVVQPIVDTPQRFIAIDSTGRITLAQASTYSEGVLENLPPLTDMPASCSFVGLTKVEVDDAYPIGTFLVPGSNGIGHIADTASYPYVRAKMLEASNGAGDIVSVRLIDEVVGSGITGAYGYTGLQGTQGGTGIKGATGIQGGTGIQAAGIKGDQGNTGVQGSTGLVSGFSGTLWGSTGIFTVALGLIVREI